jgi:hypothetical protein
MMTYQLSIFAENKPGRLAAVTQVLAKEKINIRATTIATSDTFGVINLIVDDPPRAKAALTKAGMTVTLSRVLAVVIPDQPGGLDKLTQLLVAEGININNAYGFVLEGGRGQRRSDREGRNAPRKQGLSYAGCKSLVGRGPFSLHERVRWMR